MQILKDEVRNLILNAALDEFLTCGFQRASMKQIAATSGMAVGNLYHYFKDKEALFDAIVEPVFSQILTMIQQENPHAGETQSELEQIIAAQGEVIGQLLTQNRNAILILLNGSRGSKYENMKNLLADQLAEHIQDELVQYYARKGQPVQPALAHPLAVCFLEGYYDIILRHADAETAQTVAAEYMQAFLPIFQRMT